MNERLLFLYKSEDGVQGYLETLHSVYSRIVDETSRQIYQYRLLMTFTGDIKYIRKSVLATEVGKGFQDFLAIQNKIYLYGAGIRGQRIVKMFPEMHWEGYIDRQKEGTCNGLEIVNPEQFTLKDGEIILITNLEGYDEIKESLVSYGINKDAIYTLNEFEVKAHQNQYFEERCIKCFSEKQGGFIDAGSFDGGDCIKFSKSTLNHNNSMYAFEPDKENYNNCKRILGNFNNMEIFNIGLSNVSQQVYFLSDRGECSRIAEQGNSMVNIDTIDSVMGEKRIGFIKMDIEGNEKEAIIGARRHIEKDKPNMMISVYHKLEDVIEIPKLLLEMNPDYRFALGHYSVCNADTVLYAF